MERILILGHIVLICSCGLAGQNLILNHQFDTLREVGNGDLRRFLDTFYAPHWFSPTGGTPDIYRNEDMEPSININLSQVFPFAQSVKSGAHAVGLFFLSHAGQVEHITGTLSEPLVAGQAYQVSFYLRKARTKTPSLPLGIGYKFSNRAGIFSAVGLDDRGKLDPFYQNLYRIDKVQADGVVESYIPDTNWVRVSGEYLAKGGEAYITIGMFSDRDDQKDIREYDRVLNALPARRVKLIKRGKSSRLKNFFPKKAKMDYNGSTYYFLDAVSVSEITSIDSSFPDLIPKVDPPDYALKSVDEPEPIGLTSEGKVDRGFEKQVSLNARIEMLPNHLCSILIDGNQKMSFVSNNLGTPFSFDYSFQLPANRVKGRKIDIVYHKLQDEPIEKILKSFTIIDEFKTEGYSVWVFK